MKCLYNYGFFEKKKHQLIKKWPYFTKNEFPFSWIDLPFRGYFQRVRLTMAH